MKRRQFSGLNQHYKRYSYDYYLEIMQQLGFESLELWAGTPHFWLDGMSYSGCREYRKKVNARGMQYVAFTAPSMLWQYNYCPPDQEAFEKSFAYFRNGIQAAAELGCKVMVVNSGSGRWDEDYTESIKRTKEMIALMADEAQKAGIVLAMESLQPMETNLICNLDQMKEFISEMNHPALKVMIDLVAVHVAGETVQKWFDAFGNDIVHTHFIDGNPSGHRVMGEGTIPLENVIRTYEENHYSGFFSFELGEDYIADPAAAEAKNLRMLERFTEDVNFRMQ